VVQGCGVWGPNLRLIQRNYGLKQGFEQFKSVFTFDLQHNKRQPYSDDSCLISSWKNLKARGPKPSSTSRTVRRVRAALVGNAALEEGLPEPSGSKV